MNHARCSPYPWRMKRWPRGSARRLQRLEKRQQRFLVLLAQAVEPPALILRLTLMPRYGIAQGERRPVMHEARSQPHAPQWSRAHLVLGALEVLLRKIIRHLLRHQPAIVLG